MRDLRKQLEGGIATQHVRTHLSGLIHEVTPRDILMRTLISQEGVKLYFQRKGNSSPFSSRKGLSHRGSRKLRAIYLTLERSGE